MLHPTTTTALDTTHFPASICRIDSWRKKINVSRHGRPWRGLIGRWRCGGSGERESVMLQQQPCLCLPPLGTLSYPAFAERTKLHCLWPTRRQACKLARSESTFNRPGLQTETACQSLQWRYTWSNQMYFDVIIATRRNHNDNKKSVSNYIRLLFLQGEKTGS